MGLTVGGVHAAWNYILEPEPVMDRSLLGVTGFYYKTEEVLPDDQEHQMNAMGLLEYIITNGL